MNEGRLQPQQNFYGKQLIQVGTDTQAAKTIKTIGCDFNRIYN